MPLISKQVIPSRAAIRGHPLHPMLVPFPIAFLVGTFVSDLVFQATTNPFWATASFWLASAGLVMGLLAALLGLTDFLSRPAIRQLPAAWVHFLGNGLAMALTAINVALRYDNPALGVVPAGVTLSGLVVAILVVTGWLGGELVFRHRVGVMLAESANQPDLSPEERERAANVDARAHRSRGGTRR